MFNYQTPQQSQPLAVPAGLNCLLLLCRFNFRQKSWERPTGEPLRDAHSIFLAHPAALASAISQNSSDFSDPSLGGANPAKSATRRIGIRHPFPRPLGKTKPTKKEK